jgi:hypothetical protein
MKPRVLLVAAVVSCLGAVLPAHAAPASCTWGGNPAAPTGRFTFTPGLHFEPSTGPLKFKAWGPAQGDPCAKTVVFEGTALPGASCGEIFFDGTVKGVDGVVRFNLGGLSTNAAEPLYDKAGNVVGTDTPNAINPDLAAFIVNDAADGNGLACASPQGFTSGSFSSVITVFSGGKS